MVVFLSLKPLNVYCLLIYIGILLSDDDTITDVASNTFYILGSFKSEIYSLAMHSMLKSYIAEYFIND